MKPRRRTIPPGLPKCVAELIEAPRSSSSSGVVDIGDGLVCLRCSVRGYSSPGKSGREEFVCSECEDNRAPKTTQVLRYGAPRQQPVHVGMAPSTDVETLSTARALVDVLTSSATEDVDIVVVDYHENARTANEHVALIDSAIGSRQPKFVLVLTCWKNPIAQTAAMQNVSFRHPHIYFVTFREPHLRRFGCFTDCIRTLSDEVAFVRAQPFVFLASLCHRRPEVVLFGQCATVGHCVSSICWSQEGRVS